MLAKRIIGDPSPITDDIIMSEPRDGCGPTAMRHNRLSLPFTVGPIGCFTGFLEIHQLFAEVENGTFSVLNIPMHAGTVLPRGWREPAEQDATRHGLLVQRQAETNNAAPCLESIIPSQVRGYLC